MCNGPLRPCPRRQPYSEGREVGRREEGGGGEEKGHLKIIAISAPMSSKTNCVCILYSGSIILIQLALNGNGNNVMYVS